MPLDTETTSAGVDPALQQPETAPVASTELPESVETPVEQAPAKTFTQEDIDQAINKRLARERRKWERETRTSQPVQPVQQAAPAALSVDQFESPEAYAEALATQKAEQLVSQREQTQRAQQVAEAYAEREEQARDKYDDFEQVVYNPNLRITTTMAETIRDSETGPDLAYWLGSNPKEAARIAQLPQLQQARELGKIEAKLAATPPVKKTTNAPAPITPVTARNAGTPAYDTTDPRSVKTMSTSEWIEAVRQRQIRKLQAQRN